MKDYTHELSGLIGGKMSRIQNYSEEKEAVVTYGIELILNSLLKAVIYILIGTLLGKTLEVVTAIVDIGIWHRISDTLPHIIRIAASYF